MSDPTTLDLKFLICISEMSAAVQGCSGYLKRAPDKKQKTEEFCYKFLQDVEQIASWKLKFSQVHRRTDKKINKIKSTLYFILTVQLVC